MKRLEIRRMFTLGTMVWFSILMIGCRAVPAILVDEDPNQTSATREVVQTVDEIATTVAQRTPVPTAVPGAVEKTIEQVADETGLPELSFLGLMAIDWINLLTSTLFVVIGYLLGTWLLFGFLNWAVQRTPIDADDNILKAVDRPLKWLILIVIGRIAVLRLNFLSADRVIFFNDLFFLLAIFTIIIISLRVLGHLIDWVVENRLPEANRKQLRPLVAIFRLLGNLFIILVASSVFLDHFGVNITLIAVVLLFMALIAIVVVFAAKGAIADVVSGLLILSDRPFLVGDDLYLMELDIWGEVTAIGLRITRILTSDNREVILPNSKIGASQIVNYSRPVSEIRIQTELNVPYGTDMDKVRQIIHDTVLRVEGVLQDKPVRVFYLRYVDAARLVRVYWYVDSIRKKEAVQDLVNSAIERALLEAGIDIPFPSYNLLLKQEVGGSS